ncbi:hypothetical protein QBC32DRAFT_374779 [Pseudoneurospora amorphoporcata]|uniref:Aminoglycoside phosphotransferase domain-containing protein n=1 Tax=Pseudoneurospora amorphoporcata TaxID=241081 RepID=A0AAN6NIX6_9PEZI|nr:hypothetical protein QBC32DRAFT_374779 [Pseudoneurospora amorphoporcata]
MTAPTPDAEANYSVDSAIKDFFTKTSATRAACDAKEKELVGSSEVVPVDVQGACNYTVYARPYLPLEYVVQFRLESLALKTEISSLATDIYGSLVPKVSFAGKLGENREKEALYIYLMTRTRGVTHLDFILAHGFPEDSPDNHTWRKNLMGDLHGPVMERPSTRQPGGSLPSRFQPIIQTCIDAIDDVISLPMVLLHRDFGTCNIIVNEATYHLVGVIDWVEAEICPFGLNLHFLRFLSRKLHLRNGVLGLLLSSGFTSRLANEPNPVPITEDEYGRYIMMSLDGFLIHPETMFDF